MKRMISTKAAAVAEEIKDYVKQNGKTTEFGGNVEIDGNLTVNGSAPGALHFYYITDGGEVSLKDFMIPIICDVAGLTDPTMLINKIYTDYGASVLRLPGMGTTAGNGYVVGMVMESADKTNGTFKIYTTTGDTATVEISKCGVKQVY